MKKLGLALGAGGARGIAHIGFLEVMEKYKVPIHCISGCSMGSIVGGLYASGISISQMKEVAMQMKLLDILDLNILAIRNLGVIKGKKIETLLKQYVFDKNIEDCKIKYCCIAVDVQSAKLVTLDKGELCSAMQASSAIPGVFTPITIGDYRLVDGGVISRLPIKQCRDMGADVVVSVDVIGDIEPSEHAPSNIFDLLFRAFEIMDDIKTKPERALSDININLVMDVKQTKVHNLDKAYESGRIAGENYIEQIFSLIAPKKKSFWQR